MTITADGERSRRRLPAARKALNDIMAMDLPVKAGALDGFPYKVWQLDGGRLTGGRIISPFGIYVAYLGEWGFKQFVCDSVQCAAIPMYGPLDIYGDRYFTVYETAPTGYSVYASGGANGVPIAASPHVGVAPTPDGQWKPPQPVCIAFGGEYVVLNATYERTSGHWIDCSLATHCYSDGRSDVQAAGISGIAPINTYAGFTSHRIVPMLTASGYMERLLWKEDIPYYWSANNQANFVEYQYHYAPTGVSGVPLRVTGAEVFGGASSGFKAKVAYHTDVSPLLPVTLGHFGSRTVTDVKGVLAVQVSNYASASCTPAQIDDPNHNCISYAGDSNWLLTLTFYSVTGGTSVVGYNTLSPLLSPLAAGELHWLFVDPVNGYTYQQKPEYDSMSLRVLFGYGADSDASYTLRPRDTATFADGNGVVYSWLRCCDPSAAQRATEAGVGAKLGGFRFQNPDGFIRTPLAMPQAVLADTALRPRITLMTATTYCCIADMANGEIHGLYVGSPFGSWQDVGLPVGATMYSIRVMQPGDTVATTGFIGVGKEMTQTGIQYRIYMKMAGGAWVALSQIPVSNVNDLIASWDVCVFGDDPLVQQSQQVRQHPVATQSRRPELR